MLSLLPCYNDSFAFRQLSAPRLIFPSANWSTFATSQDDKKRLAEYVTPLTILTLLQPNVLSSLISQRTFGRTQTWKDSNTAIVLAVKSATMFHRKHAAFLTTESIPLTARRLDFWFFWVLSFFSSFAAAALFVSSVTSR